MIANTPEPPYYAVIFTNIQTCDLQGYEEMANRMLELAQQQPGYLGFESARNGLGIAVSYWKDEESILAWKKQLDHQLAQRNGRNKWYADYCTRIAKVERAYSKDTSPMSS